MLSSNELYPNPGTGQIFIQVPPGEDFKIDVYDVNGKVIYSTISTDRYIDLSNHEKGIFCENEE